MIVVTFKGAKSPTLGRMKDWDIVYEPGPSVADALASAMGRFPNEPHGFLFIEPGGLIRSARTYPVMLATDWDIAAHVDRIGNSPVNPCRFSGVGRICLRTVLAKRTPNFTRVLERWRTRRSLVPDLSEAIHLAIALTEVPEARLLHLPRAWIWSEAEMRPLDPFAEPVVDFGSLKSIVSMASVRPPSNPKPKPVGPREPEVLYSSHLRDYSGYAKASRNVLFRISNSIRTRVDNSEIAREAILVDPDTNRRIDAYTTTLISERAPLFRFYTPKDEVHRGRRICSTMMETETLSREFARLLNENYQEVLVPTKWGARVFTDGGVRIPVHVVPLGVDPVVYRPGPRTPRPKATLLTTSRAGVVEVPRGYTFVTIFQPTFRKGIDHLVAAFDRAFGRRPGAASLVLATSVHAKLDQYGCAPFSRLRRGSPRSCRARIYHLTGTWNEWELAELYRSFDCYVASSIGEGYDLPLAESAACGLPVIATHCSSHKELLRGTSAWTYRPDGFGVVPGAEIVSSFYARQKFASFGEDAVESLSMLLRRAVDLLRRSGTAPVVRIHQTWDQTAALVAQRIVEANER